jgi:hypothetical protein
MPSPAPTQPKPATGHGGGRKDPVSHIIDLTEFRPGGKALCGTRVRGIKAPPTAEKCTMCEMLDAERKGRINP